MNKDKILSPYVEIEASFPFKNYARIALSGKYINSVVYNIGIDPNPSWIHCYVRGTEYWVSKEAAMEALDAGLTGRDYTFLTQEEYDKLLLLC